MPTDPPPDLELSPLGGRPRTVRQLLTNFHLCFVAFDPYEEPSSWLLPTATRILSAFEQADVRVALLVTCGPADARLWLGPHADEFLVFTDPEREAVKAFGLSELPAIVHLGMDGTIIGSAEGWDPAAWKKVTDRLAELMSWTPPLVPHPRDPAPFAGTKAS